MHHIKTALALLAPRVTPILSVQPRPIMAHEQDNPHAHNSNSGIKCVYRCMLDQTYCGESLLS